MVSKNCPKYFHGLYGLKYDHEKEKALFAYDFEYQIDYLLGSEISEAERGFVELAQARLSKENVLPNNTADQLRYFFEREFDKDVDENQG